MTSAEPHEAVTPLQNILNIDEPQAESSACASIYVRYAPTRILGVSDEQDSLVKRLADELVLFSSSDGQQKYVTDAELRVVPTPPHLLTRFHPEFESMSNSHSFASASGVGATPNLPQE